MRWGLISGVCAVRAIESFRSTYQLGAFIDQPYNTSRYVPLVRGSPYAKKDT